MIRVLLVDDQDLVRAGLRGILREVFGFEVVGECADGNVVVSAVDPLRPDVVLMDVRMPVVDGIRATRQLRLHDGTPPVLALTTFDDDEVPVSCAPAQQASSSRAYPPRTSNRRSGSWPTAAHGSTPRSPAGCWPSTARPYIRRPGHTRLSTP